MFMTNEERELRKKFRLKLEEIADRNKLFDNHGNEIKAIHITDVMRLLLAEDTEILELQKEIQKLTTNRMELMTNSAITPDNIVMEAFAKCRRLGITAFAYPQSIEDAEIIMSNANTKVFLKCDKAESLNEVLNTSKREDDVFVLDFTSSEKSQSIKIEPQNMQ